MVPMWAMIAFIKLYPLAFTGRDSVIIYWNTNFINTHHKEDYKVLIMGDSVAATCFMPEYLSEDTINLSIAGSSMLDGYYTLKHYLKNNAAPTDIFVTYMDYHLQQDNIFWRASSLVGKYTFEDNKEIYDSIMATDADVSESINMDNFWEEAIQYVIGYPGKYMNAIVQAIEEGDRLEANKKLLKKIDLHSGRYCKMVNDIYDIANSNRVGYGEFFVTDLQDLYYTRFVELCAENDIRLHIVKTPSSYYTAYTEKYEKQIREYYAGLLGGYDNMEFVWYRDEYFVEWFWDNAHMNQHGSYQFTQRLKADYPEIFGNYAATPRQMETINADINIENELSYIFKWIDKSNYTVLLYNNLPPDEKINTLYQVYLHYNDQFLMPTDIPNLYYVTGDGAALSGINFAVDDKNINLQVGSDLTSISLASKYDITAVIIDNSNGTIVRTTHANYNFEEGSFHLMD